MSLTSVLAKLCPAGPSASASDDESLLQLLPQDSSVPFWCHAGFLRARCPDLPKAVDNVVQVQEDADVVKILLQWVYAERLEDQAASAGEAPENSLAAENPQDHHNSLSSSQAARAVRLGLLWGLIDASCFKGRVAASRTTTRGKGTLAEDLCRAYDNGLVNGPVTFRAVGGEEGRADASGHRELPGGWCRLLCGQSQYFAAMLGGSWAETCQLREAGHCVVDVHWPADELARLLRFLHGGAFVEHPGHLPVAVRCADFFGVPSLHASVNDWISSHLQVANVLSLWNFVEAHPELGSVGNLPDIEAFADADSACFDLVVEKFEKFIEEEDGDDDMDDGRIRTSFLPIFELNPTLLRRVLSSGLIDVQTRRLKIIVRRYAKAKTDGESKAKFLAMCESLSPPAVLFNRDHRSTLLPQTGPPRFV